MLQKKYVQVAQRRGAEKLDNLRARFSNNQGEKNVPKYKKELRQRTNQELKKNHSKSKKKTRGREDEEMQEPSEEIFETVRKPVDRVP